MSIEFKEVPISVMSISRRKLLYGIGINDATYNISQIVENKPIKCPYYVAWASMIKRCYDKKFHTKRPTYKGCVVCTEWHSFITFKSWMEQQDWKDKVLDKDILHRGNKKYSPTTCIFVSLQLNALLLNSAASRGKYLLGVSYKKELGKFVARFFKENKEVYIGLYITEIEAHEAYCKAKAKYIIEVANQQTDVRIKSALLLRASKIHLQE